MTYCVKCGAKVEDGMRFCPECGAEIPQAQNEWSRQSFESTEQSDVFNSYQEYRQADTQRGEGYFSAEDVQANKVMGVLSYLGILVLVPLFARNKNSEYAKFHANQGLGLFIVSLIIDLLSGESVFGLHSWIHFSSGILSWGLSVMSLICFIWMIMGIVSACKGEKKELPLIGKIQILK